MNFSKKRVHFVFLIFCFSFLIVWGKAFKLQIIDRKGLLARSSDQIFREMRNYPRRGHIYDREGNPLALNVQTYSIFTIPKKGKYEKSYMSLSKIVPKISYRKIKKSIHKRSRYTWLARKIELTDRQVEKIRKLKGIYIDAVPKRFYPNQELAAQILGFVGIDNIGLSGLEYQFNKDLKGKPKVVKYVKDAKGRAIKFESRQLGDNAEDLHLSIYKDIQAVAEKALKDAVLKSRALKGGIGVMNVETGEIWAMANYPTFNPNKVSRSKEKNRKLSFISDPFEPGSLFKTFTVASALENKVVVPGTSYYCKEGRIVVDGHEINEAESDKDYDWLTVGDILKYSSNVGTVKLAFDLTYPKLRGTLKKFGIGAKTGIELPGESRGIFNYTEKVTPLSLSNISFGQGVATTGVQILAAYSSISNGGYKVIPTVFKKDENRVVLGERILSEKTTSQLKKMLVDTVEKGTGKNAIIQYFKIAGKTSTAQRPALEGGYDGHVAGFIGFPVGIKNGFVIYVYIDKPKGKYYGNQVAAPIFKKVAQYILYKRKYFNRIAINEEHEVESDIVKKKESSLESRGKKGKIPNFKGLDKKSSGLLASRFGIDIEHVGMGVVYKQKPAAGRISGKDTIVMLYHKLPEHE